MHEIISLQQGRLANYLSTHFWNAQDYYQSADLAAPAEHNGGSEGQRSPSELINHDIHFRQGLTPDGSETYLPRTLIYDLKDGFGSLKRINVLGGDGTVEEGREQIGVWYVQTRLSSISITASCYLPPMS